MGTFQTLGHINFKTRDLKASIKFYEQLGFAPFLELCNDDGQPWIVYLRFDDNLYLELTGGGPAGQNAPGPEVTGFNHLCITVDNIEKAAAELAAAGHQLMHPLDPSKIGLDNNRGAWVADPDGNRIELMEMAPGCVQYEAIKAFKAGKGLTSLIRPVAPRK
ncbi:MAG: VOC family protein [Hyphomicrobiales bacterium]|nr:MAG: VOC family protein [Hyphomicrobiales bacterium]